MKTKKKIAKPAKKGGKRPGAGRPPLPESDVRSVRKAIRLTPSEARAIEHAANGNEAEWMRETLLRRCQES